jgi:hypothetical protein
MSLSSAKLRGNRVTSELLDAETEDRLNIVKKIMVPFPL